MMAPSRSRIGAAEASTPNSRPSRRIRIASPPELDAAPFLEQRRDRVDPRLAVRLVDDAEDLLERPSDAQRRGSSRSAIRRPD